MINLFNHSLAMSKFFLFIDSYSSFRTSIVRWVIV